MPYPGVPPRRIGQFGVTQNRQCAGGGAGKIAQRGEISYHKSKECDDHEYIDGWTSEPEYNFADAVLTVKNPPGSMRDVVVTVTAGGTGRVGGPGTTEASFKSQSTCEASCIR